MHGNLIAMPSGSAKDKAAASETVPPVSDGPDSAVDSPIRHSISAPKVKGRALALLVTNALLIPTCGRLAVSW